MINIKHLGSVHTALEGNVWSCSVRSDGQKIAASSIILAIKPLATMKLQADPIIRVYNGSGIVLGFPIMNGSHNIEPYLVVVVAEACY